MGRERPILIIGGTGHYGRHIVRSLLQVGERVRLLSRNAQAARSIVGSEPEIIEGDITNVESLSPALQGARAIILSVSAGTKKLIRKRIAIERDAVLALIERSEREGARRFVYLSGYDVRREFVEPLGLLEFARPQLDVQAALADSPLNWTVLGCAPSMELFFAFIRSDVMIVPGGGPPSIPTLSPSDLGTVAAQAVVRDDLSGMHFRLTGPEAMSLPEAARRIGDVWGRPIRFRKIPLAPIRTAFFQLGWAFPFLKYIASALTLLNRFPPEMAAEVPMDHKRLLDTFDFVPTTLEREARRRKGLG
jgi:uncharacterized protein YbjT (DUF2867 family)